MLSSAVEGGSKVSKHPVDGCALLCLYLRTLFNQIFPCQSQPQLIKYFDMGIKTEDKSSAICSLKKEEEKVSSRVHLARFNDTSPHASNLGPPPSLLLMSL